MHIYYFAYGSNMSPDVLGHASADGRFVGPARLADFRLAFTRDSRTWKAGAADVVEAQGMCVWGALHELTHEFVETTLDPKEGAGVAYERTEVDVECEGDTIRALTYVVVDKNLPELPPSADYVQKLIEGAAACGLPDNYQRFLESLRTESADPYRQGLFALPTASRKKAEGMGLLRVAPEVAKEFNLKRLAVVRRRQSACVAKVDRVRGMDRTVCEVDQNVRHAVGIIGDEGYGATVMLHRVVAPRFRFARPLIKPRMLYLRLQRPRWMDSEKSICVLHENNIRMLGLSEGDYVDVYFAAEIPASGTDSSRPGYRICSASLRVFRGSATEQPRGKESIAYPQIDEVYLDAHARARIEVPAGSLDVPVIVGPDLGSLFSGRLLFYGATVFLAGAALWPLVEEGTRLLNGSKSVALGVTVALAFGLTAIFTVFDIRGRVRY